MSLLNFQGQFTTDFPALSAGILIALVPILIWYGLSQRWIVSGLLAGAVKGMTQRKAGHFGRSEASAEPSAMLTPSGPSWPCRTRDPRARSTAL